MPDPVTVWMVHLSKGASLDGIEGTLSLQEDAVVFTEATVEREARFPLAAVRKVKRLRGSPVLRLDWTHGTDARRTAFFFVRPPPLDPPDVGERRPKGDPFSTEPASALGAVRQPSRRRQRKMNTGYLQMSGIRRTEVITSWADAIAERMRRR